MDEDYLQIDKATVPIVDFVEWQRQGSLELRPFYQRRSVWNPRIKSLLIDSILRGFPLPLVFLHRTVDLKTTRPMRHVVDGQQRLRTILSFIDIDLIADPEESDRFQVLKSHNSEYFGTPFSRLPNEVQQRFLHTSLSVNVLPPSVGDAKILEIFQRMNSTGLKLNSQEIRNATYYGDFKDSSYSLAYSQHQRWLDWGIFSAQQIAQMKEVEFTSDLLGFLLRGPAPRTKQAITRLYEDFDENYPQRAEVELLFMQTFDLLHEVYSQKGAFLRRYRTTAWFYAVFAISSGTTRFGTVGVDLLLSALEHADKRIRSGEIDDGISRFLRGATADRAGRKARIDFIGNFLEI